MMKVIRMQYKDNDDLAINVTALFCETIKKHRQLWDKEDAILNRYYKGILTRTIKKCDAFLHKYGNKATDKALEAMEQTLSEEFKNLGYTEKGNDLQILQTGFMLIMLIDTLETKKKEFTGVVLKDYIRDISKEFKMYRDMWIKEIDERLAA